MEQEANLRLLSNRQIFKRLVKYVIPELKKFFAALLILILIVVIDICGPLITSEALKEMTYGEGEVVVYTNIIIISIVYFVLVVANIILVYIQALILQKAGQQVIYNLRNEIFSHIDHLSYTQLNQIPVGKLVTRVTNDTNALNELFTNVLVNLIKNFSTLIGVAIMMFVLSPKLALYMFGFMAVIAVLTAVFNKYSKVAYRNVRKNISNMNGFISENLSGMKITQIFNQEETKKEDFIKVNRQLEKSRLRQVLIFGIFRPSLTLLNMCAVAVCFYVGIKESMIGVLAVNTVWAFYLYIGRFFNPIQTLADQFNALQSAFSAGERIFNILDIPTEILDEEGAMELENIQGKIEFRDVWFAYEEENYILKGISFVIDPKKTTAFVGATGSGKTTILSLIVRNYDIQKGTILIDDIDIKKIKISSLRKCVGQMLQDVFMFSGTIESNINLKDDAISHQQVVEACEYVNANRFIEQLENKYQENVSERGSNFSSGQRQLISFARTVVHQPKILILDEATANIDTETEVLIQESLKKMMSIGTMLIVAHRLSTIQHADNIIVLQHGKIIEQGTHQNLLKKKGYYFNLYRLQFEQPS